jgi:hypothetical protein
LKAAAARSAAPQSRRSFPEALPSRQINRPNRRH